jgi:hypothetical protein
MDQVEIARSDDPGQPGNHLSRFLGPEDVTRTDVLEQFQPAPVNHKTGLGRAVLLLQGLDPLSQDRFHAAVVAIAVDV